MEHWRKRLGARLLAARIQDKDWNYAEAAREARIDAGTIHRIETGKNYEVAKLERYAEALGRPLDVWLREVLIVPNDFIRCLEEWSARESAQITPGEATTAPARQRRQGGS